MLFWSKLLIEIFKYELTKNFSFIENYQAIYSSVVFTQFSASVLVICICCFKLSQVFPFETNILKIHHD
jgi:hypothetical protein